MVDLDAVTGPGAVWKFLEDYGLEPALPPSGRGYRGTADHAISTTDADALPLTNGERASWATATATSWTVAARASSSSRS